MTSTFVALGWIQVASLLWLALLSGAVFHFVYREKVFLYWALAFAVGGLTLTWQLAILPATAAHLITSPFPYLFGSAEFGLIALAAIDCSRPGLTRRQAALIFAASWLILAAAQLLTNRMIADPGAASDVLRLERTVVNGALMAWFSVACLRSRRMRGRRGARTIVVFAFALAVHFALVTATILGFPVYSAAYSELATIVNAVLHMGMAAGMVWLALEAVAFSSKELRQSEEQFRQLTENIRQAFWLAEISPLRLIFLSRSWEDIWGRSREAVLRDPALFLQWVHPDDMPRIKVALDRFSESGFTDAVEFRIIRPNGEIRWIRNRRFAVNTRRFVGVGEDITDERRVREIEERFHRVFEDGPVGIAMIGMNGKISRANLALADMLGYPAEDLPGVNLADFVHPEDAETEKQLSGDLFGEKIPSYRIEMRYSRRDGRIIWVDQAVTIVRDSDGELLYAIVMAADITERKNAESGLRDLTDRLLQLQDEERRRIARDLHDSTGQNLVALKLNLMSLREVPIAAHQAETIPDSLALVDRMLTEIRTISYLLHPPLLDELGLASAVRTYLLGFSSRSGIAVDFQTSEPITRLGAEVELALFRIVQEGLTNVHRHSRSQRCWIRLQLNNETIMLEIRDEGQGMPAEIVERFRRGLGTVGVGLAGMQERARQLGGRLSLESGSGGSRIVVSLPLGSNN